MGLFSYSRHYIGNSREELDASAVKDIKEYLTEKQWDIMMQAVGGETWQTVSHCLAFAGVGGYPVHAFGRAYMRVEYRAWMASGAEPIYTDRFGYAIDDEEQTVKLLGAEYKDLVGYDPFEEPGGSTVKDVWELLISYLQLMVTQENCDRNGENFTDRTAEHYPNLSIAGQ